jgi:hypothetical protein
VLHLFRFTCAITLTDTREQATARQVLERLGLIESSFLYTFILRNNLGMSLQYLIGDLGRSLPLTIIRQLFNDLILTVLLQLQIRL